MLFHLHFMKYLSIIKIIENESGVGPSDHTSFYNSDIPVLHFFTGQHEDYHKPTDDFEKLNYEGMQAISDYIIEVDADSSNTNHGVSGWVYDVSDLLG